MTKHRIVKILSAAAALAVTTQAHALIFSSTGDPTFNTTAPSGTSAGGASLTNSGWQYEGSFAGGYLATPIAPHYFLSAAHLNASSGTISLGGVNYASAPFPSDGSSFKNFGDLRLYYTPQTFYSYAPLYTPADGSEVGKDVVVVGRGLKRGSLINVNGQDKGWLWDSTDTSSTQRWGENKVSGIADFAVGGDQKLLQFTFDRSGSSASVGPNEATLAAGDSGGGVFINVNGQWKLDGINYGVSGPFGLTAAGPSFMAALVDMGGLFNLNGSAQFITDTTPDIPESWFASRISESYGGLAALIGLAPTWNVDSSGSWSTASNWTNGTVVNGADAVADFRTAITAPRTITVPSTTLGTIDFDDASSYTLNPVNGSSVLTFAVTTGSAAINVASGNHTIAVPITLNSNMNFNVIPANSTLTISGALTASGRAITKQGLGVVQSPNVRASSLTISQGQFRIASNGTSSGTSRVSTLSVAAGAQLNLNNNDMVVDYTGASPIGSWNGSSYTGLLGLVASGRNGGSWNGAGIMSTTAAGSSGLTGIGVAEASQALNLSGSETAIWSGQTVDAGSVLIKYTYAGDLNLDGRIDGDDYFIIDSNIGNPSARGYAMGDVDLNGRVNGDDYFWLDSNVKAQGAGLAGVSGAGISAVPEPSSIALVFLISAGAVARRRRRQRDR